MYAAFSSFAFTFPQAASLEFVELAKSFAPEAEAVWGEDGLDKVLRSPVHAVALVLPAQIQVRHLNLHSLSLLRDTTHNFAFHGYKWCRPCSSLSATSTFPS